MKEFTLFIYLAADNDLDNFAKKDIHELEKFGSGDKLNVVIQVDFFNATTLRGQISKNPNWTQGDITLYSQLTNIGETNTGDPNVLSDFITWGINNFPAEKYGLIIWNHGNGWKPNFIIGEAKSVFGDLVGEQFRVDFVLDALTAITKRNIFRATAERKLNALFKSLCDENDNLIVERVLDIRAIGVDFGSNYDALDTIELEKVFVQVNQNLNQNVKFSFLGFDACLMSSLEVHFQLNNYASLIVSSEEIEPGVGWSYDQVVSTYSSDEKQWCKNIVDSYYDSLLNYRVRLITLSVVELRFISELVSKIDTTAATMNILLESNYMKFAESEKKATRYFDKDLIDTGDYYAKLSTLVNNSSLNPLIADFNNTYQSCVLYNRFNFNYRNEQPTGLSNYYPSKPSFDKSYLDLKISNSLTNWIAFIKKYHFI